MARGVVRAIISIQINGPVCRAAEIQTLDPGNTTSIPILGHPGHPLHVVIDDNVALVARILLEIVNGFDEVADLKVRNIAGCAGTSPRSCSRSLADISAVLTIAAGGYHLK